MLLVQHAGHHDGWAVLGGAVEIGESPAETAIRETREEIGADIRITRLLDVLGGPDYEHSSKLSVASDAIFSGLR